MKEDKKNKIKKKCQRMCCLCLETASVSQFQH